LVTPPKYCNERSAEVSETTGKKSSSNHVVIILLVTIFALIVLVLIGVLFYRKFIKSELTKDMSSRVSELVANYANKVSAQKKRHREKMMESFDEEL
jgi:flagellar basal body-associated protein FliL